MDTTIVAEQTHQPCPSCGSSDALTINSDGSSKCFSCGEWKVGDNYTARLTTSTKPNMNYSFLSGEYLDIPARKINRDTCKKLGYSIGSKDGEPCHIATYKTPEGETVGQKLRFKDKRFSCIGKPSVFFGQHLHPNGGKRLVITEGEIDALTVSQVFDNKWPVVSLPTGAQSAVSVFKQQFSWLSSWDEVVLMFDNDEQGRNAMKEASNILPSGKVKLAKLAHKDANDALLKGEGKAVVYAVYNAQVWRPDDIIDGVDVYDRLKNPRKIKAVPYPYAGLNAKTHGIRRGEIVTFCAGSGIGKSLVCRFIAHDLLVEHESRIGYIALEESIERTAQGIMSIELKKPLHLHHDAFDQATEQAFFKTVGCGRFFMYDHWGSLEGSHLIDRIRYMAKCMDVEYVVLDHLSIVVSGLGDGDERRLIDNTMTRLRALVEETNIGLILVSHLKRPEGRGHEEGANTSLAQLRGSASIAQLSDMVIGLERDQQNLENADLTCVRVLKNRFSGETGIATRLHYDKVTGLLAESTLDVDNPF